MGSGGGSSSGPITYAPYLEWTHHDLLRKGGIVVTPGYDLVSVLNRTFNQSPYGDYVPPDIESQFLSGLDISAFPSLYDMFGKFMAGMDIEVLWDQIQEGTVYHPAVDTLVSAHSTMLEEEIDINTMPKILAGLRDINCIMSSVLPAAKAIVYDGKIKAVSRFDGELRFKLVELAAKRWESHLNWNKQVLLMYAEYSKLYLTARQDFDSITMEYATKDALWNISLFEYARAFLGALGGTAATVAQNGPSKGQAAMSGAMSGAAIGASSGGVVGIGVGAIVGGVAGYLSA